MAKWVVIGGGFKGIAAASILSRDGTSVTVIEQSDGLGGILRSQPVNGLYLDNGCHLFTNRVREATQLMVDILDGDIHPVHVEYASITDGHKNEQLAIPEFTHLSDETKRNILWELVQQTASDQASPTICSMKTALEQTFGPTLAGHLAECIRKITHVSPDQLDSTALNKLPLGRVKCFSDDTSLKLKNIPELDDCLGVPSQQNPLTFYDKAHEEFPFKNFYPSSKGLMGFCEASTDFLKEQGVDIKTGTSVKNLRNEPKNLQVEFQGGGTIQADRVLWALEPGLLSEILFDDEELTNHSHQIPLNLYYFFVPSDVSPQYTYYHDFSSESLVFRGSAPGFYGRQENDQNLSYLCAEVPAKFGTDLWENPDSFLPEVWDELRDVGMVDREEFEDSYINQTPVSYPLHKNGYQELFREVKTEINQRYPRIHIADPNTYGKTEIIGSLRSSISEIKP